MNKEQLRQVLESYMNGTASAEDRAVIDKWYDQYKENPGYTDSLSATEQAALRKEIFNNIQSEINVPVQQTARKIHISKWWKMSAAAAVISIITVFVWQQQRQDPTYAGYNNFTNNTGTIIKKVLSDSSVVWLKPNASISYPGTFAAASRNVKMNGECFFEITKNPAQPFIIESSHLVTKVWGTSFLVSDMENKPDAAVTVVSGKVSVNKKETGTADLVPAMKSSEVILLPEQKIVYSENNHALVAETNADMKPLKIWHPSDLSFENVTLKELFNELEKQFDTPIEMGDNTVANKRMTADFSGLNLPEILELIKKTMPVDYSIQQDKIAILKK